MAIEVREFKDGRYLVWDGFNCEALNWEYLCLKDDDVKAYLKENPLPKDREYSEEDLLGDIHATGGITLYCEKEETADYIAEMIYRLL